MDTFRFVGVDDSAFRSLFDLPDDRLRAIGALRVVATESSGFPCRVSLEDAAVGEELLLLPYEHQPAASPYRASGPIYVRRAATRRTLAPGEVPPYVARRLISVRGYDDRDMMIAAAVCDGAVVADEIARQFSEDRVAYIHLHNAKQGCFSCRVERVRTRA